ncbi:hypothetical protein GCM10007424_16280 [Flavobacterium suaedae]|uniref:Uncharacterized protein n=1 Tax=Flavobacterium suaedae TaxID=1767027 RepID=A0ABQ1JWZ1_9FLAO|nr:hypothetical protein [Flavobacterium suaedae]GGB77009.1 hypothetical protein GCM10007424_16280 [Flavobacterium suaedae]
MKKFLPLLAVVVLFATGCASTALKKQSADVALEYEAVTRGTYKKVIVKQDTVITLNENNVNKAITTVLPKKDWNSILKMLSKIDYKKLNTIAPPSTKHQVDAALAAGLKVITKDRTYHSHTFDHGNPPEALQPLVEKILEVSALKEK